MISPRHFSNEMLSCYYEFKYRTVIKLERLYLMRNRSDAHCILGAQLYEWQ